jgi:hypothetical protein
MHKSRQKEKKIFSASRWPKLLPSTKKANWAPGPCANFQEITMENMPVLPLEEGVQILELRLRELLDAKNPTFATHSLLFLSGIEQK